MSREVPQEFDLTDPDHHSLVFDMADALVAGHDDWCDIEQPEDGDVFGHIAARMARGRLYALSMDGGASVVAITNLLGENNRLRPKDEDNPNGEASLERKIRELSWLTCGTILRVDLLYVSGGDWWGTEDVFEAEMVRTEALRRISGIDVAMVRMNDHAGWGDRRHNDKGGEWNLGLRLAANGLLRQVYNHVYITDADTTLNLAAGVGEGLMHARENGWDVVLGNRKDPESILQKDVKRSGPGVGWYYYLSRHLGRQFLDMGVSDTQCPSKFYSLEAAQAIDRWASTDTHGVDTDYANALLAEGYDLHFVPVVAVDSEAESSGHKMPHDGVPDPAYRLHFIITGQIEQLERYRHVLQLRHYEESRRIADLYEQRIMGYNLSVPWEGLSRLLKSDLPEFQELEIAGFTPDEIEVDAFERVLDRVLGEV